jgi:hypothetical protein
MDHGLSRRLADADESGEFKARTRLGPRVMAELFAEVAKPFAAPDSSGFYKALVAGQR